MDSCSTSDGMLSGCLARVICGQQGWGGRWMMMETGTWGGVKGGISLAIYLLHRRLVFSWLFCVQGNLFNVYQGLYTSN